MLRIFFCNFRNTKRWRYFGRWSRSCWLVLSSLWSGSFESFPSLCPSSSTPRPSLWWVSASCTSTTGCLVCSFPSVLCWVQWWSTLKQWWDLQYKLYTRLFSPWFYFSYLEINFSSNEGQYLSLRQNNNKNAYIL